MKFGYQGAFHRDDDNLFPTISNSSLMQFHVQHTVRSDAGRLATPCPTPLRSRPASRCSQACSRGRCAPSTTRSTRRNSGPRIRLTLQGALRFDRAWSSFPEQQIGPSVTIPNAIVLPAQMGIKGYNDLSPRIGVAYDLFGNGKTSLKGNVGRYLHPASNQGRYINANPSELISTITGRPLDRRPTATSRPDCNLLNGAAAEPGDDRDSSRHLRRFGRSELRTSQGRDEARRLDSRWLGRAAVRLAVRRVRPAGADAESLGRGRVLPPVVADLRRRRHHRQHPDHGRRLLAIQRDRPERSAAAEQRRIHRSQHLQHQRWRQSLVAPDNVQTAANDFGSYTRYWDGFDVTAQARLGNGLYAAGRHEHRTSRRSTSASRARRCRRAGRPTRTAVRSSRC